MCIHQLRCGSLKVFRLTAQIDGSTASCPAAHACQLAGITLVLPTATTYTIVTLTFASAACMMSPAV
jgi:hypothetical protein